VPYCARTLDYNPGPLSYAQLNQGHPRQTLDLPPDEWLAEIGKLPWRYSPGEYWLYNTASDILGVLIARASGLDLAEFLHQRLFEPLGMTDTGFVVPPEKLNRFTVAYALDSTGQKVVAVDHPANTFYATPPIFYSGAAGLVSTADDYLKFGRMLLGKGKLDNERILSRKTVELMTTDHLTWEQRAAAIGGPGFASNQGFGFGVATFNEQTQLGPSVGAFTWGGAYGTHWLADPQEDLVIILLIQMMGGTQKISEDFNTLVYQAIDD
jgi:CubicO group peptidase (beta-lactamase class C family)